MLELHLNNDFRSSDQGGDLMIMKKPQTSVWGNYKINSEASERRFVF